MFSLSSAPLREVSPFLTRINRNSSFIISELFLCILQDMSQFCVDPMGVVKLVPPPPPPPMPPPEEESEPPPKPPFADEEEEEEMMLREELLKSLASKRGVRAEVTHTHTRSLSDKHYHTHAHTSPLDR